MLHRFQAEFRSFSKLPFFTCEKKLRKTITNVQGMRGKFKREISDFSKLASDDLLLTSNDLQIRRPSKPCQSHT